LTAGQDLPPLLAEKLSRCWRHGHDPQAPYLSETFPRANNLLDQQELRGSIPAMHQLKLLE
jgi:hypothetical protein